MHETQKKKAPRIVYACTVWMHILEMHPEKCGFIAYSASCRYMNNALMAFPSLFA
jgi:hypothetical protein